MFGPAAGDWHARRPRLALRDQGFLHKRSLSGRGAFDALVEDLHARGMDKDGDGHWLGRVGPHAGWRGPTTVTCPTRDTGNRLDRVRFVA